MDEQNNTMYLLEVKLPTLEDVLYQLETETKYCPYQNTRKKGDLSRYVIKLISDKLGVDVSLEDLE